MYQTRLEKLYAFMEEERAEALLLTSPQHVFYLTGFLTEPHERFLGLLLPQGEEPVLIVPALDIEAAKQASVVGNIVGVADTEDPYQVVKASLPPRTTRMGIEKKHMSVTRYEELSAVLEVKEYFDVEPVLRSLRLRKSPDEIERIKRAVHLVELVLKEGLKNVTVGKAEAELVAELEYLMKKLGAEGPSFDTMVLVGENSAMPHGVPGQRRIQNGDFLLIDMGVAADGYVSDITRTFVVGEVTPKQREVYEAVLAANQAAIAAVKPGASVASLDRTARQLIADRGYGSFFIHRLGHGMGLEVHEYPSVHGENQDELAPGMVFTIEPGIYLPGWGGVRIEDDVLVTDSGVEVLTSFPKELTVLG
ncbi:MAG: aminopeptidase P family protein [Brevibacillus sp.]|nr:aminopeptidase P family protein [Brevibacillus sp.]